MQRRRTRQHPHESAAPRAAGALLANGAQGCKRTHAQRLARQRETRCSAPARAGCSPWGASAATAPAPSPPPGRRRLRRRPRRPRRHPASRPSRRRRLRRASPRPCPPWRGRREEAGKAARQEMDMARVVPAGCMDACLLVLICHAAAFPRFSGVRFTAVRAQTTAITLTKNKQRRNAAAASVQQLCQARCNRSSAASCARCQLRTRSQLKILARESSALSAA
jgi:hypothetical protein